LCEIEIYGTLLITEAARDEMMSQNWNQQRRSVTFYVTEPEYQLITSKAELLEMSSSKFTKKAVTTYIKNLEKHLQDAGLVAL
jgi:hypothetical protein